MPPENNARDPLGPDEPPLPDFHEVLAALPNPELLNALDLTLLELEKRLVRYAHVGPEILEMADEGLLLAVRAKARLGQALSSAQPHRKSLASRRSGRLEAHLYPPRVEYRASH